MTDPCMAPLSSQDPGSIVASLGSQDSRDYFSLDVSHLSEEPNTVQGGEFVQVS
jgi:hypothetical protein